MTTQSCLARLCDWKQTHESFAPRFKAAYFTLCHEPRMKGEAICEKCFHRPLGDLESIQGSNRMYGLITDPIPYTAKVYGSTFYTKMIEITGATPPSAWLVRAKLAHHMLETRAQKAIANGDIPLLKLEKEDTVMPPKKKVIALAKPLPKAQTLMRTFTPIHTLYVETAEQPKVYATDAQGIWKQELAGEQCWISESGHVFLDQDGVIGDFLGFWKDGELVAVE
jgi:hypothetical protein